MLARIRKAMDEKEQGFTLIELLVVMIIIGILAAIAIPVFLNQRAKARDTSTKADVSTIGKEIATYYVDGSGSLTLAVDATAKTYTLTSNDATPYTASGKVSDGSTMLSQVTYSDSTKKDTTWCVALTNTSGQQQSYKYSAQGGLQPGACTAP